MDRDLVSQWVTMWGVGYGPLREWVLCVICIFCCLIFFVQSEHQICWNYIIFNEVLTVISCGLEANVWWQILVLSVGALQDSETWRTLPPAVHGCWFPLTKIFLMKNVMTSSLKQHFLFLSLFMEAVWQSYTWSSINNSKTWETKSFNLAPAHKMSLLPACLRCIRPALQSWALAEI